MSETAEEPTPKRDADDEENDVEVLLGAPLVLLWLHHVCPVIHRITYDNVACCCDFDCFLTSDMSLTDVRSSSRPFAGPVVVASRLPRSCSCSQARILLSPVLSYLEIEQPSADY